MMTTTQTFETSSNSSEVNSSRFRRGLWLTLATVLTAGPTFGLSSPVTATAPAWIPGTYWVATARSGMPQQASHTNAVAAYGNGRFVVGGSGSSLSPYLISSTDGATFVSRKKADWTITQYERLSNEVTITTSTDHLVSVGQKFPVANSTIATALGTTVNSSFVVNAVPTPTTLTFTLAGADVGAAAGTFANDFRNNEGASALVYGGAAGSEVFLMSSVGGPNKVWRSTDGENWSVVAFHGDNGGRNSTSWTSAAYGAGKFVALTDSSTHRIIYSSDNGTTWLTASLPAGLSASTWSSVAYGEGKFVAVSQTKTAAQVMTSEDGITWTSRSAAEANWWRSVAYGDGNFMAVASDGTNRIMTSDDGITWTARNVPAHATAQWRAVAWAGSAFVVTGTSSTVAATTDVGATWTSMVDGIAGGGAFNNATITAMVWTGSLLLGVPNETGKGISQSFAPSAPTVSSQTPTTGTSAGGTSVTFAGNWLRSVTSVTVDGQPATITARGGGATLTTLSNNSSSLTVTMPAGTSGGQRTITLNGLAGTATGSFTYNWAAPTLTTNVSVSGSTIGGDSVVLTGTNLNGATAVTLGTSVSSASENSTNVTSFTVSGTTSITAVVPPRPCGQTANDWYFRVTTPGGTTAGSANFKHTYATNPTPSISALGTSSGNSAGGQTVVITGSDFRCVSSVKFGNVNAASYVLDSPTQITAVTPAASAGAVAVTVTTEDGVATSSTNFTFVTATTTTTTTPTATTVPTSNSSVGTSSNPAPSLVTSANQAALEAEPGEAVAVINGKKVEVEVVSVPAAATPAQELRIAQNIVATINDLLPSGTTNSIRAISTPTGAELTGMIVNPDNPSEKLNVPIDSVKLIKAGDSAAVLLTGLNQTNLPATSDAKGALEVTRGGIVAARAFGLPGLETGEIVLMSTPRLLKTFTVSANGTYSGQVPLPTDIGFGSHTVVMATANAKVSLGIKLVRTRMQFRVNKVVSTRLFKNRAKVKASGGKVTVRAKGRCKANNKRIVMAKKPGGCYITVRQAAKGQYKAVYYRFTVSVVKKAPKVKKVVSKKK